jgi:hypothetical protein
MSYPMRMILSSLTALLLCSLLPAQLQAQGRTKCPEDPRPVAAAPAPVALPFLAERRLNITADAVLEREGPLPDASRSYTARAVDPELSVRGDALCFAQRPAVPAVRALDFYHRDVLGYTTNNFSYMLNPHTGVFDRLDISFSVVSSGQPKLYEHFLILRDKLAQVLGPQNAQGLHLRKGVAGKITRENIDRLLLRQRVIPEAHWRVGALDITLVGMAFVEPYRGSYTVAHLSISANPYDKIARRRDEAVDYDPKLRPLIK